MLIKVSRKTKKHTESLSETLGQFILTDEGYYNKRAQSLPGEVCVMVSCLVLILYNGIARGTTIPQLNNLRQMRFNYFCSEDSLMHTRALLSFFFRVLLDFLYWILKKKNRLYFPHYPISLDSNMEISIFFLWLDLSLRTNWMS